MNNGISIRMHCCATGGRSIMKTTVYCLDEVQGTTATLASFRITDYTQDFRNQN